MTAPQLHLIRSTTSVEFVGAIRIPGTPVAGTRDAVIIGRNSGRMRAMVKWRVNYVAWKKDAVRLLVGWRRRLIGAHAMTVAIRGPVIIEQEFVFGRPGCTARKPGGLAPVYTIRGERYPYPLPWTDNQRPYLGMVDLDNLSKGPGDALVAAGILADDRWAFRTASAKYYGATGERPATVIRLWRYIER